MKSYLAKTICLLLILGLFSTFVQGCGSFSGSDERSISDFAKSQYSINVGEQSKISLTISPEGLSADDFIFSLSAPDLATISEVTVKDGWFSSELTFTITSLAEGSTSLKVAFADGSDSTNEVQIISEIPTKVTSFGEFRQSSTSMYIGDTKTLTWHILPSGLLREDFVLNISDESVISVQETSFGDDEKGSALVLSISGLKEGSSVLSLTSSDGKLTSKPFEIKVESAPVIESFVAPDSTTVNMYVGETYTLTQLISPSTITKDDFEVHVSDEAVISVKQKSFSVSDEYAELVLSVKALSAGSSIITFSAADGKTRTLSITFIATVKDTSRTVYITPYGEKYHFSAACAGDNASPISLNQARSQGYEPCKKCAQ